MKKGELILSIIAAGVVLFQPVGNASAQDENMNGAAAVHQLVYGDMAEQITDNPQKSIVKERVPNGILYGVRRGGKWSVVSSTGEKISADMYDKIQSPAEGVFLAEKDDKWGAFNDAWVQIFPCIYQKLTVINQDRLLLQDKDKEGLGDIKGNVLLPAEYKNIFWDEAGMDNFLAWKDDKTCSFVDYNGKIMFSGELKDAKPFTRGRAAVKKDNKWGYMDRTGQMIIPAQYKEAMPFYDDETLVQDDKGIKSIGLDGKETANIQGSQILLPYYNGYGVVKNNGNIEYIDKSGKVLTSVSVDQAFPFVNGSAMIERKKSTMNLGATLLGAVVGSVIGSNIIGGRDIWLPVDIMQKYKIGYINQQGVEYIPTKNDFNGIFCKNRVMTCIKDKYGYLGRNGEVIVPAEFDDISDFCGTKDDIVVVRQEDAYSYYQVGKGIFRKSYEDARPFADGMAAVDIGNGQWEYIDENGQTVIRTHFEEAGDFSEGVAAVKINGGAALIDKTGAYIVAPDKGYEDFGPCINGVLPCKQKGKWGLMDKTGKIILAAQYDEITAY